MSKSDKASIWISKNLLSKRDREANIKAYDRDTKDFRDAAKRTALGVGIGSGMGSAILGTTYRSFLNSGPINKKRAAISIASNALLDGGLGATAGYLVTKAKGSMINKTRSKSEKMDKKYQKVADINRVASGKMSEEDFIEKYGEE